MLRIWESGLWRAANSNFKIGAFRENFLFLYFFFKFNILNFREIGRESGAVINVLCKCNGLILFFSLKNNLFTDKINLISCFFF